MAANGKLASSALVAVGGTRLTKRTADAWRAMAAACPVPLTITGNGGYRSYATQVDMKKRPSVYGISALKARLLAPAGKSPHGWGTAVDVGSFGATYGTTGLRRQIWVLANMGDYGFSRPLGPRDPNHLVHNGSALAGGNVTPITVTEDTMYIAVNANNSNEETRRLLVTSVSARVITKEQSRVYVKLGVPGVTVTREEWLILHADGLARIALLKGDGKVTDLSAVTKAIVDGFTALPDAVANRIRTFFATGK